MIRKFPVLTGVNLTGGEWLWDSTYAPVEGSNYMFVSNQDVDYVAAKGFNFARLTFSWELLQPTLNGPLLTTGYGASMKARVDYLTGKGLYVLVEPHGGADAAFARYKGNLVGSTAVPNSAFADFWTKVAELYKTNPRVALGLSNEPHGMSTVQWYDAAQAAITGIRSTGSTAMIFVAGNGYSQPSSWNDSWYDSAAMKVSNATGWGTLSDSLNNTIVSVHTYFDANAGGGANDIVGPDIIATRLKPVVDWARAKGLKVHLSEFGASSLTSGANTAVANACNYVKANSDVVIGWSWWAYGPPAWWGGYRFTLCPKNNYTTDDPKVAWLQPFMAPLQNPADFVDPPPAVPNIVLTKTTAKAPADQSTSTKKVVPTGMNVPAGTYTLTVQTRTMYSDQTSFTASISLSNAHTNVDLSWQEMVIDLRGHTISSIWGAEVLSADPATGFVTVRPVGGIPMTVLSQGRNGFGFFLTRTTTAAALNNQVLVKSIKW